MKKRVLQHPPQSEPLVELEGGTVSGLWWKFFTLIVFYLPFINTYTVVYDMSSVAANSIEVKTMIINNVKTGEVVILNKPSYTTGLLVHQAWCSANGTLSFCVQNTTGSPIDPNSETYRIVTIAL